MDSDDISLPGRFEQQLQYIVTHPDIDVLGCAIDEFTSDENMINATRLCPERVNSYIKFRSPVNHPTAFFESRRYSKLEAINIVSLWKITTFGSACMPWG